MLALLFLSLFVVNVGSLFKGLLKGNVGSLFKGLFEGIQVRYIRNIVQFS
jgi:predicted alpha-1,6-mannanase (GH76 family)